MSNVADYDSETMAFSHNDNSEPNYRLSATWSAPQFISPDLRRRSVYSKRNRSGNRMERSGEIEHFSLNAHFAQPLTFSSGPSCPEEEDANDSGD